MTFQFIYAPNTRALKYKKNTTTFKSHTDSYMDSGKTTISTSPTVSHPDKNYKRNARTDIINQMDLTDKLQNIPPKCKKTYLLLSTSWNVLQNWSHT